MDSERALRPSQPPDPEARLRWLLERQTDAMVHLATAVERLTAAVDQLGRRVAALDARLGAT
jgi:hypothetical protein